MSIDEAREMTREERDLLVAMRGMMHSGGWDDTPLKCVILAIEALIDAKLSPAPVGEDGVAGVTSDLMSHSAPTPPAKDTGEAYSYAVSLFLHLAPRCEPLPDLIGVLTQIDNATTVIPDMRKQIADLEARLAEATNELHCCDDIPLNGGLAAGIAALRTALADARKRER